MGSRPAWEPGTLSVYQQSGVRALCGLHRGERDGRVGVIEQVGRGLELRAQQQAARAPVVSEGDQQHLLLLEGARLVRVGLGLAD